MFLDLRVFGEPVWSGHSRIEQNRITWAHDCGDDGCLVNLEDDPTEHRNLAAGTSTVGTGVGASGNGVDPAHAAVMVELHAALKQLNTAIFTPHRGEDSVAACEAALNNGGFYGPFVDVVYNRDGDGAGRVKAGATGGRGGTGYGQEGGGGG